jgi:hypothetical protein
VSDLLEYMYTGQVSVKADELEAVAGVAGTLGIQLELPAPTNNDPAPDVDQVSIL